MEYLVKVIPEEKILGHPRMPRSIPRGQVVVVLVQLA
jgi:hypothetical protein